MCATNSPSSPLSRVAKFPQRQSPNVAEMSEPTDGRSAGKAQIVSRRKERNVVAIGSMLDLSYSDSPTANKERNVKADEDAHGLSSLKSLRKAKPRASYREPDAFPKKEQISQQPKSSVLVFTQQSKAAQKGLTEMSWQTAVPLRKNHDLPRSSHIGRNVVSNEERRLPTSVVAVDGGNPSSFLSLPLTPPRACSEWVESLAGG